MPNVFTSLELDLHWLGAIAGIATLIYSLYNMILAQSKPAGLHTGDAHRVLRTRYLVIASILFIAFAVVLWRPLHIHLHWLLQLGISLLGALLFFPGLILYVWELRSLGESFNVSSGFGVRLQQAHRLVTKGPYAYMRNPMYLGVMLVMWGGFLLYRTWTMLIFAVMMFRLIVRAKKEEKAMEQVFGRQYELYKRTIPAWFPRLEKLFPGVPKNRAQKS